MTTEEQHRFFILLGQLAPKALAGALLVTVSVWLLWSPASVSGWLPDAAVTIAAAKILLCIGILVSGSALLATRHRLVHFGYRRDPDEELWEAVQWLSASERRSILLPDRLAARFFEPDALQVFGRAHRRSWVLADAGMLSGACVPAGAQPIPYPGTTAALVPPKVFGATGL